MSNDHYRSFDSATRAQKTTITFSMERTDDESPDLSYLEQDYSDLTRDERAKCKEQDSERLRAYRSGDWCMIGIRARAEITVPIGQGSFCCYELTSAGLWGIESDSGAEYLAEVFEEEKGELVRAMVAMGLAAAELEKA